MDGSINIVRGYVPWAFCMSILMDGVGDALKRHKDEPQKPYSILTAQTCPKQKTQCFLHPESLILDQHAYIQTNIKQIYFLSAACMSVNAALHGRSRVLDLSPKKKKEF